MHLSRNVIALESNRKYHINVMADCVRKGQTDNKYR
jgi:hypothetical protein